MPQNFRHERWRERQGSEDRGRYRGEDREFRSGWDDEGHRGRSSGREGNEHPARFGGHHGSDRGSSDYGHPTRSRYDERRFEEGDRWTPDVEDRDLGGPEFSMARNRRTSTSRWLEDGEDSGGYFNTGSYIDDGGAWRGFGRDFERARRQQERDFGSYRDQERDRDTSGDFSNYGRSYYGAQSNYGRGQPDEPWGSRTPRRTYEDRSSWNYGSSRRAGLGPTSGAYGYDLGAAYEPERQRQSFRGRGPQGYRRSDERLKEVICERLTDDPAIDASDVSIDVTNQCVKLTGTVDDRRTKYDIEELVERCGGVNDIDNQLRVRSTRPSQGASTQSRQEVQGGSGWESGSNGTTSTVGRSESRGTTARKS